MAQEETRSRGEESNHAAAYAEQQKVEADSAQQEKFNKVINRRHVLQECWRDVITQKKAEVRDQLVIRKDMRRRFQKVPVKIDFLLVVCWFSTVFCD